MLRRMLAVTLLVLGTGVILAQEAQKPAEKAALDSLRAEVAALRQAVKKDVDAINKAANSAVKFSGVLYTYYQYTTNGTEGNDFNRVDVDRLYLTAKATISENTRLTATTDVFRQTDATKNAFYGGLVIRVKFAYAEYSPSSDIAVRLGMIPTHWQGMVDGIWKYRVLIANITDNTRAGYNASSDLGASATYTLPSKLGEIFAGIYNGSGYSNPEANRFKDFALRATLTPVANEPLTLAAYYYMGNGESTIKQSLGKNRWGALASYSYSGVTVGLDYNEKQDKAKPANITLADTTQSGRAISFFGEAKAPFDGFLGTLAFLWRLDYIDANTSVGQDITRYWIAGISCKVNDKLTVIVDRQTNKTESAVMLTRVDKAKIDYDNRWFLHVQLNF
jgi:hypothetical protein